MNLFPARPDAALLIVGHGSTVNPDSAAPSLVHAAAIRRRNLFAQVACVFWKEEPSLRDWPLLFDPAEIREVFVVPNFISEGYFTRTVIPRELDLDRLPDGAPAPIHPPRGLGPDVALLPARRQPSGDDRACSCNAPARWPPGVPEAETSLLIVGHGTSLNDNSAVAAKQQVEAIRALGRYAAVLNTYMEEPPLISDWAKLTATPNVVVVPFFHFRRSAQLPGYSRAAGHRDRADRQRQRTCAGRGGVRAKSPPPCTAGRSIMPVRSAQRRASRRLSSSRPWEVSTRRNWLLPDSLASGCREPFS